MWGLFVYLFDTTNESVLVVIGDGCLMGFLLLLGLYMFIVGVGVLGNCL